ncbi:MAG: hypothetical protein AAF623_08265 [Planctomycetota bacterium]
MQTFFESTTGFRFSLLRDLVLTILIFVLPNAHQSLLGQSDHSQAPILYSSSDFNDRVARLIQKLKVNEETIQWDAEHGWLPDLLMKLEIPTSSQTLVFSKTSQQHRKINPANPRAIYFNDDVYLGYVPNGDFLEIASVDPVQGAAFYTLDQRKSDRAIIKEASANCLSCHETYKTQRVPGFLIRSVYPKTSGHPEFRFGTTTTDHRTPFTDRFGGWYVTGHHGQIRHRGNAMVIPKSKQESNALDRESHSNLDDLPTRVSLKKYLGKKSDIVALMVMEHQTQFHNFVTRASYETRIALHQQQEMNRILERPADFRIESTNRRIKSVATKLVEYLFFKDEFPLASPIQGDERFLVDFQTTAIRDPKGRSLRELDLQTRLLKYRCSYLIYSPSFCSLPKPALTVVSDEINDILAGNRPGAYPQLDEGTRDSIREILTATHPLFRKSK